MISKMRIHQGTLASVARLSKVLATLLVAIIAASFSSGLYAADMFKGRQIYTSNCAICHGPTGRAVMPGTPNFARQEGILKPDMTLLATIRSGRNAMPAYQGILSDRDIMDVIAFIRTLN
jgi:cytochrome c6